MVLAEHRGGGKLRNRIEPRMHASMQGNRESMEVHRRALVLARAGRLNRRRDVSISLLADDELKLVIAHLSWHDNTHSLAPNHRATTSPPPGRGQLLPLAAWRWLPLASAAAWLTATSQRCAPRYLHSQPSQNLAARNIISRHNQIFCR